MTLIDVLFVLAALSLVGLVVAADMASLSNFRRPIAALMLLLAGGLTYVLLATDTKGSFFFGSFSEVEEEHGGGRRAGAIQKLKQDGRRPGQQPSGPGDGDGEGEEESGGKSRRVGSVDDARGRGKSGGGDEAREGGGGGAAQRKGGSGGAESDGKGKGGAGESQQGGAGDGAGGGGPEGKAGSGGRGASNPHGGDGRGQPDGGKGEAAQVAAVPGPPPIPLRDSDVQDCPYCPVMALIPAGNANIGAPEDEEGRISEEGPVRPVTFRLPFYLGRFEVRRVEFHRFVVESGHRLQKGCTIGARYDTKGSYLRPGFAQTDDDPVVCVSWTDASAYGRWLSARTGVDYRLPSEAEWEYAARAGSSANFASGNTISLKAAHFESARSGTVPVGRYAPNGFGLFDMSGNAWEWVEDCWHDSLTTLPVDGRARAEPRCETRTMRGGAWYNSARYVRLSARWANPERAGGNGVGFRVARNIFTKRRER